MHATGSITACTVDVLNLGEVFYCCNFPLLFPFFIFLQVTLLLLEQNQPDAEAIWINQGK